MAIIVFQHSDIGTPGRLGLTLRDHGFKLRIVRPDRGEAIPLDFDGVEGVVSMGGPQNVDDPVGKWAWMPGEMAYLKGAHDRQLPVIGVCLGHQMLAAALGGEVGPIDPGQGPEMGFHAVEIGPAGQTDAVLAGIAWKSMQFQSHGREVKKLPAGALALSSSARCKVQSFRAGLRSYGFQYHFEVDRAGVEKLVRSDAECLSRAGLSVEEAMRQAETHYAGFARLADRLCLNLATCLFPRVFRGASGRDSADGPASIPASTATALR